jgi:hypothetical protein
MISPEREGKDVFLAGRKLEGRRHGSRKVPQSLDLLRSRIFEFHRLPPKTNHLLPIPD